MSGELVVVDLKNISSIEIFQDKIKLHEDKQIVALTPYSFYVLDNLNLEYETLHYFVSKKLFRERVINNINSIEKNLKRDCEAHMIDLIKYISFIEYEKTIKYIFELLGNKSITYITDVDYIEYDSTNNTSIFATLTNIDINWTQIPGMPSQKKNILLKYKEFSFDKLHIRLLNKLLKIELLYDWTNFAWFIYKDFVLRPSINDQKIKKSTCTSISLNIL